MALVGCVGVSQELVVMSHHEDVDAGLFRELSHERPTERYVSVGQSGKRFVEDKEITHTHPRHDRKTQDEGDDDRCTTPERVDRITLHPVLLDNKLHVKLVCLRFRTNVEIDVLVVDDMTKAGCYELADGVDILVNGLVKPVLKDLAFLLPKVRMVLEFLLLGLTVGDLTVEHLFVNRELAHLGFHQ